MPSSCATLVAVYGGEDANQATRGVELVHLVGAEARDEEVAAVVEGHAGGEAALAGIQDRV